METANKYLISRNFQSDSTILYRRRPAISYICIRNPVCRGTFGIQEVLVGKNAEQETDVQPLPRSSAKENRKKFLRSIVQQSHEQAQPDKRF